MLGGDAKWQWRKLHKPYYHGNDKRHEGARNKDILTQGVNLSHHATSSICFYINRLSLTFFKLTHLITVVKKNIPA